MFQDGGARARTGLAAEGTDGGPRRARFQGGLLTELVKLVHRVRAAGLRRAFRGPHAGLLGATLAATAGRGRLLTRAGAWLGRRRLGLVDLTLGIGLFILGLTGLHLRLGLTLTRFLGLALLVTAPRGWLVPGFLAALLRVGRLLLLGAAGLLVLVLAFLGAGVLALVLLTRLPVLILLILGLLCLGVLLLSLLPLGILILGFILTSFLLLRRLILGLLALALLLLCLPILGLPFPLPTRRVLGSLLFLGGFTRLWLVPLLDLLG